MVSKDNADLIRQYVDLYGPCVVNVDCSFWLLSPAGEHQRIVIAALDALVAERDDYRRMVDDLQRDDERVQARVTELEAALDEYAEHQSWRCGHPDRYSQDPDCPCGLVQTWRDLGFMVEYDAEGSGAVLLMTLAAPTKDK